MGASSTISFIVGRQDDIWIPLSVDRIVYFESYQKKTFIYTEEGCYTSKYPLKTLEQRLSENFIRIHRSYIVNIAYISQISRNISSNLEVTLYMQENTLLPISQSYVQKVRSMLGF
nr:LytTR family DNA-binding domain-containing protein [Bacillus alkalicola]